MNNEQREKKLSSNISFLSNCLLKLKTFLYTFIYFFWTDAQHLPSCCRAISASTAWIYFYLNIYSFNQRPSLFSSYNQYRKCWDTPPLSYFKSLLVTRLWDTIPTFPILYFQSSPLSFEDGLVLLGTSDRVRLIASTRSRARNLSQKRYSGSSIFATGCSY